MLSNNEDKPKKKGHRVTRWLRIIHRDLGFLMVGICLVYGISGFLLNHMNGKDPAFKTTEATVQLEKGLSNDELAVLWGDKKLPPLRKVMTIDEEHARLMLNGGVGVYSSATGVADYEVYKKNEFIYWINRLHYNKVNGWTIMADIFAFSLVFFAISGLFMVKGRKGIAGRGKWYLIAGILIPVLYVILA